MQAACCCSGSKQRCRDLVSWASRSSVSTSRASDSCFSCTSTTQRTRSHRGVVRQWRLSSASWRIRTNQLIEVPSDSRHEGAAAPCAQKGSNASSSGSRGGSGSSA